MRRIVVEVCLFHVHRVSSIFFFFQAEDGIRDVAVTGVQTCALPICLIGPFHSLPGGCVTYFYASRRCLAAASSAGLQPAPDMVSTRVVAIEMERFMQIGRASCRERV